MKPGRTAADARIGADVLEDAQAVGLDGSVPAPSDREVEDGGATVVHGDHVLAAALGPADGTPRVPGQPGDQDLLDAEHLGAETAADVRRHDTHVGRLEAEDHRQSVAILMRGLRREPHRQPAVVPDDGRARARLERARRQPLADEAPRHDHVAAVEQRLVALRRVAHADVGACLGEEQHIAGERLLGVDCGRQRVVVDDHELGGVDARPRGTR